MPGKEEPAKVATAARGAWGCSEPLHAWPAWRQAGPYGIRLHTKMRSEGIPSQPLRRLTLVCKQEAATSGVSRSCGTHGQFGTRVGPNPGRSDSSPYLMKKVSAHRPPQLQFLPAPMGYFCWKHGWAFKVRHEGCYSTCSAPNVNRQHRKILEIFPRGMGQKVIN